MIDRISRMYVHYPAYRQYPYTPLATNVAYSHRTGQLVSGIMSNAKLEAAYMYPRQELETYLIRTAENSKRYDGNGIYNAVGNVTLTADINGFPYRGQRIDIKI